MRKIKVLSLVAMVVALTFACSKDEPQPDPDPNTTTISNAYVEYYIDGIKHEPTYNNIIFVANTFAALFIDSVKIIGTSFETYGSTIDITNYDDFEYNTLKTYNLSDGSSAKFLHYSDDSIFNYSSFCDSSISSFTITKFDTANKIMSGTFHGTVCQAMDSSFNTITGGIFTDVPY